MKIQESSSEIKNAKDFIEYLELSWENWNGREIRLMVPDEDGTVYILDFLQKSGMCVTWKKDDPILTSTIIRVEYAINLIKLHNWILC